MMHALLLAARLLAPNQADGIVACTTVAVGEHRFAACQLLDPDGKPRATRSRHVLPQPDGTVDVDVLVGAHAELSRELWLTVAQ